VTVRMSALGHYRTGTCAAATSALHQQADIPNSLLGAVPFPVCNKKIPVPIAGNSSKDVSCFNGLCKRGGAFQLKFPVFSHGSGNSDSGDAFAVASQHSHTKSLLQIAFKSSRTGCIRGRIPRCSRARGFGAKWQRPFGAKFRLAPLRKSLGRHSGVNYPV
jgi:hypothetical protein